MTTVNTDHKDGMVRMGFSSKGDTSHQIVLELTPQEARDIAATLLKRADLAESGAPEDTESNSP